MFKSIYVLCLVSCALVMVIPVLAAVGWFGYPVRVTAATPLMPPLFLLVMFNVLLFLPTFFALIGLLFYALFKRMWKQFGFVVCALIAFLVGWKVIMRIWPLSV